MKLIEVYQTSLQQIIRLAEEQRKVVVFKGYDPKIFQSCGLAIYKDPIREDGLISLDLIHAHKVEIYQKLITPTSEIKFLLFEQLAFAFETSIEPIRPNILVVEDNLRVLFPYALDQKDLQQDTEADNDEIPFLTPLNSYSEIIEIQSKKYVKYISDIDNLITYPLFDSKVNIVETSISAEYPLIEVEPDSTSLDIYIDDILADTAPPRLCIELQSNNPSYPRLNSSLEILNACLSLCEGSVVYLESEPVIHKIEKQELLNALLKQYWGNAAAFRDINMYENPRVSNRTTAISQAVIIDHILRELDSVIEKRDHRDIFITAPTGAGKSLLFQLPAFHLSDQGRVTIVISPLIALMKDQVQSIINNRKFQKVAYLNSELNLIEREAVINGVRNGDIDLLYLSPELLLSYDITHFIGERRLGLVIIDEAHLVTTWGRDFRVDYWFLGNHLRKIRKFNNEDFVILACTATAVFGGANDMAFDCMDSLALKNPLYFIGSVKREDIHFIIGRDTPQGGFDEFKLKQTIDFCEAVLSTTDLKSLVYAPYIKHINSVSDGLSEQSKSLTSYYYGKLEAATKNQYFDEFLKGDRRLMLATKAFGMGIDISDIQVVYHHAPSGHLADYIQEIGRLARDPNLHGYALINFSQHDVRYAMVLHGLSSVKPWELKAVIERLYKMYQTEQEKNLLFSVEDFANIFPDALDLGQKVLTALMMIEKDYLVKHRFNVILARPKKLFSKVYVRVDHHIKSDFIRDFGVACKELDHSITLERNAYSFYEVNLDRLWRTNYRDQSFPKFKTSFFTQELFGALKPFIVPQVKFTFHLTRSRHSALDVYKKFLETIFNFFPLQTKRYFKEEVFVDHLIKAGYKDALAKTIAERVLTMYGRASGHETDQDPFLQTKKAYDGSGDIFNIFRNTHTSEHHELQRLLSRIFGEEKTEYVKYVGKNGASHKRMMRFCYLLELSQCGLYEVTGGEAPMIFVRLNDPRRLKYDSHRRDYSNLLLDDVHRRHKVSMQVFKHFFLREMNDSERWNFVEAYFLGRSVEDLFDEFNGTEPTFSVQPATALLSLLGNGGLESDTSSEGEVGVEPTLENAANADEHEDGDHEEEYVQDEDDAETQLDFKNNGLDEDIIERPVKGKFYNESHLLSLTRNQTLITKRIKQWLQEDPVTLAIARDRHGLRFESHIWSELEAAIKLSESYARHRDGFMLPIRMNSTILKPAKVWFVEDPVKFYRWYKNHSHEVILSLPEKISVYEKVYNLRKNELIPEHLKLLKK